MTTSHYVAVAIIVPVYNVENYLRECLDSLIHQSLSNIYIICINDGSTDKSGAILDEYSKKDPRIHIITQENQGLGSARNTGLSYVYSLPLPPQYIGFVDSDDVVDITMFEKLYKKAEEYNADIAYGLTRLYGDPVDTIWAPHSPPAKCFTPRDTSSSFFSIKLSVAWDSIYSTSLLQKNRLLFPNSLHEDTLWFITTFICADRVTYVEEALYIYRRLREGGLTATHVNTLLTGEEKFFIVYRQYIDTMQWLSQHTLLSQYDSHINTLTISLLANFIQERPEEKDTVLWWAEQYLPTPLYMKILHTTSSTPPPKKKFSLRSLFFKKKR